MSANNSTSSSQSEDGSHSASSNPTPVITHAPVGSQIDNVSSAGSGSEVVESYQESLASFCSVQQQIGPYTNTVYRVQVEPKRTGWARLSDLLGEYDQKRFEDTKEDIDALLVFAGLFSAVITAFIIESYKTLQSQPEDITNELLRNISMQLAGLTVAIADRNPVNLTIQSATQELFVPATTSIVVNTLWIWSLIIALITASLGILVKQWFHEFMAHRTEESRIQVINRFFRDEGIENWKIFQFAAFLPFLLQIALLLFFVGLAIFLKDINIVVAKSAVALMAVWLAMLVFVTFAPLMSAQCPYSTPILKDTLSSLQPTFSSMGNTARSRMACLILSFLNQLRLRMRCFQIPYYLCRRYTRRVCSWRDRVPVNRIDHYLDLSILAGCERVLRGQEMHDTLIELIRDCDLKEVSTSLQSALSLMPLGEGHPFSREPVIGWHPKYDPSNRGAMARLYLKSLQGGYLQNILTGVRREDTGTLYYIIFSTLMIIVDRALYRDLVKSLHPPGQMSVAKGLRALCLDGVEASAFVFLSTCQTLQPSIYGERPYGVNGESRFDPSALRYLQESSSGDKIVENLVAEIATILTGDLSNPALLARSLGHRDRIMWPITWTYTFSCFLSYAGRDACLRKKADLMGPMGYIADRLRGEWQGRRPGGAISSLCLKEVDDIFREMGLVEEFEDFTTTISSLLPLPT